MPHPRGKQSVNCPLLCCVQQMVIYLKYRVVLLFLFCVSAFGDYIHVHSVALHCILGTIRTIPFVFVIDLILHNFWTIIHVWIW